MNEDIRGTIFSQFIKLACRCDRHPEEVANLIITKEEVQPRGLVCALCLPLSEHFRNKEELQTKSFKMMLLQIHQSCQALLSDAITSAFVDHHILLIRGIAKNHFKDIEHNLQAAITNYFHKTKQLLTGKYFQEFYLAMSSIEAIKNKNKNQSSNDGRELAKWNARLLNFIFGFDKLLNQYEEYSNLSLQERMSGKHLLKHIRNQVGQMYKDFKEKSQALKKNYNEQQILSIFNVSESSSKTFKFSTTLVNSQLKVTDPKSLKMPNLPENEYTLLALIEPCIGSKKRSIKLKMDGIKGWVSVGIAFRAQVEHSNYKFDQTNHGTVQISYDGYSWSNDAAVNEQYTSWYFNQNDTITMTVNPPTGELTFNRNQESNPYTLKFTKQKKDKIYFCVSVNYNGDAVTILD